MQERWWPDLHRAIHDVWHHDSKTVDAPGGPYGMGVEYQMAADLFDEEDPDFVLWLITEAPAVMGWNSEPRSLKWAKRIQNLDQARTEYSKRQRPVTEGVQLASQAVRSEAPPRRRDPQAEKARLESLRAGA